MTKSHPTTRKPNHHKLYLVGVFLVLTILRGPPDTVSRNAQEQAEDSDYRYCDRNSTQPHCCNPQRCQQIRKTTLYSACCHNLPDPTQKKKESSTLDVYPVLVTGTPRSGTDFTKTLINNLGGNVTHDWNSVRGGSGGMVSWMHLRKEDQDHWFGPAELEGARFYSAWHQVRNPLKGLTSLAFSEPIQEIGYVPFLNRHIRVEGWCHDDGIPPKEQYRCLLQQGLEFYTQWHEFIETLNLPRFRLEDLTEDHDLDLLDEIFASMDLPPPNHKKAMRLLEGVHKTNSRKHRPTLEWWELCHANTTLTHKFFKLAKGWGYYPELEEPCDEAAMNHPAAEGIYLETNSHVFDRPGLKKKDKATREAVMAGRLRQAKKEALASLRTAR